MPLTLRRAVLLAAALAGAALTARLGFWQLDRAAQKIAMETAMDSRRGLPPLPLPELARDEAGAEQQHYRPIVAEGRWALGHNVYLENRPMGERTGFIVVTPLVLADGSAVAVQRGWLPRDITDRTKLAPPPTPAGPVTVAGHIAPPPSRLYELGRPVGGAIRQNLDLAAYAAETHLALRPLSIVQDDGPLTPADGLLRQWPRPAVDVQRHYGYAFQWFAFAALIIGSYVWFQLIRPRRPGR